MRVSAPFHSLPRTTFIVLGIGVPPPGRSLGDVRSIRPSAAALPSCKCGIGQAERGLAGALQDICPFAVFGDQLR
ncbi:hypothetical protein, partial [Salmonella sp. SAL04284]|uniref:hypothetical protein n=1 Tax=Salmonella sp. SAL04284 TaxID=3159862 RepID=UPI00397E7F78